LRALLDAEPDLEIVGEADAMEALACLADRTHPDIILLDLGLHGLQGLETLRWLTRNLPETQTLLLIDDEDASLVCAALAAGAAGCVVGRAAAATLAAAVRTASQGCLYIQPGVRQKLLPAAFPQPTSLDARQ